MLRKILHIIPILFLVNAFGQQEDYEKKQRELEERKAKLQEELLEINSKFIKEKKKEKSVLKELANQNAKIAVNEKIIYTTNKQKRVLSDNIYTKQLEINKYKREIEVLKIDYSNMIVKSYKSRSEQSRIMFILSSENFNQAYKRVQYMKQYAGFRKRQAEEIKDKQIKLEEAKNYLEQKKKEKEVVLVQSAKEHENLEKEKKEKVKIMQVIQKDKNKLASEMKKIKKETKDIDRKIKRVIADAIAAANRRNAEKRRLELEAKGGTVSTKIEPVSSSKIELTPEGKIESDNFKSNRGRLPWPVEKGFISLNFGTQPHPEFKNLDVYCSGVEITTDPSSSARSVFSGEVSQVQLVGNGNYAVYIMHGDYFTVYLNLSSVNVAKGQRVKEKQTLGKIKTNSKGKTVLKFLVNQNTSSLNPRSWIAPK